MKYGMWVVWVGSAAAILFGSGIVSTAGHILFWLTFVVHTGEFLVKRPVFEKAGGSMSHHFVQTLIYGFFYWKPLEEGLQE